MIRFKGDDWRWKKRLRGGKRVVTEESKRSGEKDGL